MVTYFDRDEVEPALGGQGFGDQGLGAARWAVEQDSSGRGDTKSGKGFWMFDGPLHGLA